MDAIENSLLIKDVKISILEDLSKISPIANEDVKLITKGIDDSHKPFLLTSKDDYLIIENGLICKNYIIKFNENDVELVKNFLESSFGLKQLNDFSKRTDESSETQYFHFYSLLSQQQNMMQDYIRTSTYYKAIFTNYLDFKDKVVVDVGAGSGILSFFAAYVGAKKVYAVEASNMAHFANKLVLNNGLNNIIEVVQGKIEEISLPEYVDIIISEPLGYMLLNERMLETFLHAKKWLKPEGNMFPTTSNLYIAPFTDEALYLEIYNRSAFWSQTSFYGIDLTSLREDALIEGFQQPIVDTFDMRICMAKAVSYNINFLKASESDLEDITINLKYQIEFSSHLHGLAFWFDVAFIGKSEIIMLSTGPSEPLTHWYQVRCLFHKPLLCLYNHTLTGSIHLKSNKRQSYDVSFTLVNDVTGGKVENCHVDLKNPYFRYNPSSSYNAQSVTRVASSAEINENLTNQYSYNNTSIDPNYINYNLNNNNNCSNHQFKEQSSRNNDLINEPNDFIQNGYHLQLSNPSYLTFNNQQIQNPSFMPDNNSLRGNVSGSEPIRFLNSNKLVPPFSDISQFPPHKLTKYEEPKSQECPIAPPHSTTLRALNTQTIQTFYAGQNDHMNQNLN